MSTKKISIDEAVSKMMNEVSYAEGERAFKCADGYYVAFFRIGNRKGATLGKIPSPNKTFPFTDLSAFSIDEIMEKIAEYTTTATVLKEPYRYKPYCS